MTPSSPCAASETQPQRPWQVPSDPPETNEKARRAYSALLTVTAREPDDTRYQNFSDEVSQERRLLTRQ